ncbi:MAG TPA: Na+/H+ antiporter subunit G [bacterium (Candidatus Stahlbacteria)]|nr:Na+/H+ antiporter subunit G [Candidatus Stahlbacteria bacterium]
MIETIGWIIIWIGVIFDILGCLGLVRFPDVYNRLQASTKCVTLGTFGIMVGIFLINRFTPLGIKALICGLFILLTSPVGAHALMRGSLIFGIRLWKDSVIDRYGKEKLGGERIER